MNCPKCSSKSEVTDSRPKDGSVRRRRKCLSCGHKYTSYEVGAVEIAIIRKWAKMVKTNAKTLRGLAKRAEDMAKLAIPRGFAER